MIPILGKENFGKEIIQFFFLQKKGERVGETWLLHWQYTMVKGVETKKKKKKGSLN